MYDVAMTIVDLAGPFLGCLAGLALFNVSASAAESLAKAVRKARVSAAIDSVEIVETR